MQTKREWIAGFIAVRALRCLVLYTAPEGGFMFKMNRKVEYALMALKHMEAKRPGELTSAKEICDVYGSPFDATSRVLQVMASRGLLKSEHGAFGGYLLIRDLKKVSLHDLMAMILGPVALAKCLQSNGQGTCELESNCNIRSPIQVVNAKLIDFCKEINLFDMIHPHKTGARAEFHEAAL